MIRILIFLVIVAMSCRTPSKEDPPVDDPPPQDTTVVDTTITPPLDTFERTRLAGTLGFIPSENERQYDVDMASFLLGYTPVDPRNTPGTVVIDPQKHSSWEDAGINHPNNWVFLLLPGDYTPWGAITPKVSGTANRSRVFRPYYEGDEAPYDVEHPYDIVNSGMWGYEVRLEAFDLRTISYTVFHKLSFRGRFNEKKGVIGGPTSKFAYESNGNIVDRCYFGSVAAPMALRIFNSSYNHVQNSFFDRVITKTGRGDQGGITVSATYQKESRGNRITGNEFRNQTDAVGLMYNTPKEDPFDESLWAKSQMGEVPETVIDNNDVYVSPESYVLNDQGILSAGTEDGLDIKAGASNPKDKVIITNNRIWGFPLTNTEYGGTGSMGPGIVLHRAAQNILIENNIIFDCHQGIVVHAPSPKKGPFEGVKNVAIQNNLIYDLKKLIPDHAGSGLALQLMASTDIDVSFNSIINVRRWAVIKENKAKINFQCNMVADVDVGTAYPKDKISYSSDNAWYGYPSEDDIFAPSSGDHLFLDNYDKANMAEYSFYTNLVSGPKLVTLKNAIPSRQGEGPWIDPGDDCGCYEGGLCASEQWWVDTTTFYRDTVIILGYGN